jgi:hypothetical protein
MIQDGTSGKSDELTQEFDKQISLADKSLDELAEDLALLPETSDEASMYHAEVIRRQEQAALDGTTAPLVSEKRKYSIWTLFIFGIAVFAFVASLVFQK